MLIPALYKLRHLPTDVETTRVHGERGVVAEGTARCGPLCAIPAVLDRLGIDTDDLLSQCGLTRWYFDDPENTVTFKVVGHLFHRSVEAAGCDHLGVLVGQPVTLSSLGAVGVLMHASPDVAHALQVMARHFHVQDRGSQLSVDIDGDAVTMSYRITVPDVEAVDQIYMVAALTGGAVLRALCGKGWRPLEVQFPFRRPRNTGPLRKALDAPLKFDAERLKIIFRTSELARPLPTADPLLYRMMAERIEQLEAKQRRDLVDRVRDVMQTLIFLDDSRSSIVARRIGMSLRTLNRRLSDLGTNLREIRDRACADTACQLLKNTEKSASEVALILGYSDSSAFTRAFRRWRGVPPAQWRARKRRAD